MAKRGRPAQTIQLTTAEDPLLWKYDCLNDAIKANIDLLAALIRTDEASHKVTDETSSPTQQTNHKKSRVAER